jgi:isopenicillin N synthase-like dioxygenase
VVDIPVLSLAPCFSDDSQAILALARRLDEACAGVGFLLIADHGLKQATLDEAFCLSGNFFDGEQRLKDRWHPSAHGQQRGYHGYETRALAATLGNDTPPDRRESYFLGPVDDHRAYFSHLPAAAGAYAPNIYADAPVGFSAALVALYRQFEVLSVALLRLMALALGAPAGYFDDKSGRHFSILASHFYPPPARPARPGQLRTGEHTDFGAFTILAMTAGEGGLQVKLPGGEWRAVQTKPGELVVNLGDMMARWTNERWVSTLHRVANPTIGDGARSRRQSIAYFMHPDYDARIECIASVLAPGAEARHPGITAGEHIRAKIARSHGGAGSA